MMVKARLRKTCLLLVATALLGTSLAGPRFADRIRSGNAKISAELQEKLTDVARTDGDLPVIVRVTPEFFELSRELLPARSTIPLVGAFRARLTPEEILELSRLNITEDITFDSLIHLSGKKDDPPVAENRSDYLAAIGADQAQELGYTGKGVTVAVFDSGVGKRPDIDERIAAKVDFTTGEANVFVSDKEARKSSLWKDEYGHGTHVAGIVASSGEHSEGTYKGVAPEAEVLDLRVVGPDGTGRLSDLLLAIDWLVANKETYKVGVANLSLGRPARDSYQNDILCQAVDQLVDAGIITVVSAGNLGKTDDYPELWGSITNPGNCPSVITVGSINTRGTPGHDDDIATTYGSRGPTYLDGLLKPDLSAPANAIGSLLAKESVLQNDYSDLRIDFHHISLSGSSMATAFVSGTAALMLQANSKLTPRLVKAVLMLNAIRLTEPHVLVQGNGLVNALTSTLMAKQMEVHDQNVKQKVDPFWDLDGDTVWAGGAIAVADLVGYSDLVPSPPSAYWGSGVNWEDHLSWDGGIGWADSIFSPGSVLWQSNESGLPGMVSDSVLWSDSFLWTNSVFWTASVFWTSSVLWSDSVLSFDANATFFSDSVFWTSGEMGADSAISHDYRGDQ